MPVKALIFDSGIGGFSVFEHIRKVLPGLDSLYLMDNQLFPYGIQADDVLIPRIVSLCQKACTQHAIDLLVIACNTASTIALPALRETLRIPVVGVVPAIKTAANLSQSKHIALLATPATIDRPYIDNLIEEHGQQCEVTRIGSSELVKLAEEYWFSGVLAKDHLHSILAGHIEPSLLNKHPIDQVILGCTHFPIVGKLISNLFPTLNLVDSGEAIARRVCFILQKQGHDLNLFTQSSKQHQLLSTAPIDNKEAFLNACRRIAPYQSFNII